MLRGNCLKMLWGLVCLIGMFSAGVQYSAENTSIHQLQQDFTSHKDFGFSWGSNPAVKNPWYEVDLERDRLCNMVSFYAL